MNPCLISLLLGNIVIFSLIYNLSITLFPTPIPGKFVNVEPCGNTLCEEIELDAGNFCIYKVPYNNRGDILIREYLFNQTKYLNHRKEIVQKVFFEKNEKKWCSVLYKDIELIDRIFIYFFIGLPVSLIFGVSIYVFICFLCRCFIVNPKLKSELVYHV